jgi:hypothetical protein
MVKNTSSGVSALATVAAATPTHPIMIAARHRGDRHLPSGKMAAITPIASR